MLRRPDCKFTKPVTLGIRARSAARARSPSAARAAARPSSVQSLPRVHVRDLGPAARDAVPDLQAPFLVEKNTKKDGLTLALPPVQVRQFAAGNASVREALDAVPDRARRAAARLAAHARRLSPRRHPRARPGAAAPVEPVARRGRGTASCSSARCATCTAPATRPRAPRGRWRRGAASRVSACGAASSRAIPRARCRSRGGPRRLPRTLPAVDLARALDRSSAATPPRRATAR